MIAVVNEIAKVRAKKGAGKTICENSPRYSSGSNGVVERAIGSAVAQMRVMRSALEDRLEILLGSRHAAWAWMAEYAGYLLNRQEVGHDGKTSYERSKGKKAKAFGIVFSKRCCGRGSRAEAAWASWPSCGTMTSSLGSRARPENSLWETRTASTGRGP